MSIWLTLQLVIAAIVLLAFGYRSTGGALRVLTGGAALLAAIAGTAGSIGLFWLGQKSHWTSDGPGMLFVMIALGLCLLVAFVGWRVVFGIMAGGGERTPIDSLPSARGGLQQVLRIAGFALLAIAVVGQVVSAVARRGRTAHTSPVVAVSFLGANRLVTIDAVGTIVEWDVFSKREVRRETMPALAGAASLFVDDYHGSGFAIVNGAALRFAPFSRTPPETIPAARHIARGAAVVVAQEGALVFVSGADWSRPPLHTLAWPEPIVALDARERFVGVADVASVSLLDGRPGFVGTIASVPAPGTISGLTVLPEGMLLAFDGSGAAWAIEARRNTVAPLAAKVSLAASAKRTFLVSGRDVSEYEPWKKTATPLGRIGSGARSIDTTGDQVAFGFENGEVVLGKLTRSKLEMIELTSAP